jgi:cytochrome c556
MRRMRSGSTMPSPTRSAGTVAAGLLVVALAACCLAAGPRQVVKRARPPASWDALTLGTFADDAFSLLVGSREDLFKSLAPVTVATVDPGEEMEDGAHGDFDRRDMMKKLDAAEKALAEAVASDKSFAAAVSKVDQAADLVIMMGKTLFSSDPDYSDDDDYLKFAENMTGAGKRLKVAAKSGDHSAAGSAFGELRKSCDSCHEGFR